MLESIYRQAGLRTGLFTSPHLVSFRERMQVNRELIPEKALARLTAQLRDSAAGFPEGQGPTFFEVAVVTALCHFAEQSCDIVLWETGLGGRLDATNIVTPLASVITNIGLDHTRWLGETHAAIAAEKAGIIKPGIPALTAAAQPEALAVIRAEAARQGAELIELGQAESTADLPLLGRHQQTNASLAKAVVEAIAGRVAGAAWGDSRRLGQGALAGATAGHPARRTDGTARRRAQRRGRSDAAAGFGGQVFRRLAGFHPRHGGREGRRRVLRRVGDLDQAHRFVAGQQRPLGQAGRVFTDVPSGQSGGGDRGCRVAWPSAGVVRGRAVCGGRRVVLPRGRGDGTARSGPNAERGRAATERLGSAGMQAKDSFGLTWRGEYRHKTRPRRGALVYRLGRRPLKAERRVQFSYALPPRRHCGRQSP